MTTDFTVWRDGFNFFVTPNTDEAFTHLWENTDGHWLGRSIFVEHRYIEDLVQGLRENGYTVEAE